MARKKTYKDGYKRVTVKVDPSVNNTLSVKGKEDPRIFAIEQFMLGSLSERFVLCDLQKSDRFRLVNDVRPLYDIRRIVGYIEKMNDDLTEAIIMITKCKDIEEDFFNNKILYFNIFHRYNTQEGSIQIFNAYLDKKETEDDDG